MNGLNAEARLPAVKNTHAPFVDVFLEVPRPYAAASLVRVPPRRLVAEKDGGKTGGKKEARHSSGAVCCFMHKKWLTEATSLMRVIKQL